MDVDRDTGEEQTQEAQKSVQVVEPTISGSESLKALREQQAGGVSASFVSKAIPGMAGQPSTGNDERIEPSGTESSAEGSMAVDVLKENKAEKSQKLAQIPEPSTPISSYEGLYKALPPSLKISTSKESGRGLYSSVFYQPGDVLFSVKPHVAALSLPHLDGYCSSCFGNGGDSQLKRCTACKTVMYCSPACQSKDWSSHKNECNALQAWIKAASAESQGEVSPPSDAIRCLGRVLWKRHKLGPSHAWASFFFLFSASLPNYNDADRTSLPKDPDPFNTEVHTHLAHGVVGYLGLTSPQQLEPYGIHSAADLVDLVSRFTTNTFTVTTPTLSPLGACVAPSVALINHSCDPNAVVVFPRAGGDADKANEPLLQVIALKYIQPGDEVLTSYIDTTLPRELRLKTLKETYHFTCKCSLCSPAPGSPVDMREAMWCPKRCGGVCCLPTEPEDSFTRCSKCGSVVKDTDAVLDALRIGQEALEKAERVQDLDPRKALQLTENLSQILISAGLVPSAHPLLALSRLHTSLLITKLSTDPESNIEEVFSPQIREQSSSPSDFSPRHGQEEAQKALDDAIRSATRANTGLSQVLAFGHPARGVSVAELGKLLTVDEPVPKDIQNGGDILNATTPMPPPNSPSYPPSGPNRLKLAHETLVRARSELLVGFGNSNEGGEVGKQIRQQIVDVEKELSVWRTGIRNAMKTASSKKPIQ
ncbi:hypothetical protein H1R20_g2714, partial [Candolleomyces eurysporus]